MDDRSIEQYYETVILPLFHIELKEDIVWKDHGKVGLDTWAHYFENKSGVEYILVNEDFPGSEYPADDLTHQMIVAPNSEDGIIKVTIGDDWIPNISGYFSLYKEKRQQPPKTT